MALNYAEFSIRSTHTWWFPTEWNVLDQTVVNWHKIRSLLTKSEWRGQRLVRWHWRSYLTSLSLSFLLGIKVWLPFMNININMYRKDDQRWSLNGRIVSDFYFHTTFMSLSLLDIYFLMRESTKNASLGLKIIMTAFHFIVIISEVSCVCGQDTVTSPKAESPGSEQTRRRHWATARPLSNACPGYQCPSLLHTSFFPGQRCGRGHLLASQPWRGYP